MVIKCPICKNKANLIYDQLYDKDYFVKGKFSMFECINCSLKFINPLLNETQLQKYYPSDKYYSYNKRSKLAGLYHKISSYYYSKKSILFNILFGLFSPLLYHYRFFSGKKILEIGCGNGMQLKFYKMHDLETKGLEPYGPELSNEEKAIGIERKSVKNAKFEKDYFDLIVMKEVLEHIPDPKQTLLKCKSWLKKGGKLIIVVPNGEGLGAKFFKNNWYGYDVPRHVYTYNSKSISFMLNKLGFKVNKIKNYDLPYMIDGSLKFSSVDKSKGKKKNHNIIFSNFSKLLFAPLSLIATYLKLGSIIEVEAERI
jgi:2-polyprenyl-3-methyl-5-hydroxy-6-metoxy-1,4-benzoquinol methylase